MTESAGFEPAGLSPNELATRRVKPDSANSPEYATGFEPALCRFAGDCLTAQPRVQEEGRGLEPRMRFRVCFRDRTRIQFRCSLPNAHRRSRTFTDRVLTAVSLPLDYVGEYLESIEMRNDNWTRD